MQLIFLSNASSAPNIPKATQPSIFLYYRLLWLRIVSTSWTLPCFDPDELTGKLSSPHQMRKLVSISSKSTQERWIWQEGSTWEKSQRLCLDLQGKYFNFSKKFFTALLVACLVTSYNSQNFTRFWLLTSKLHKILVDWSIASLIAMAMRWFPAAHRAMVKLLWFWLYDWWF